MTKIEKFDDISFVLQTLAGYIQGAPESDVLICNEFPQLVACAKNLRLFYVTQDTENSFLTRLRTYEFTSLTRALKLILIGIYGRKLDMEWDQTWFRDLEIVQELVHAPML